MSTKVYDETSGIEACRKWQLRALEEYPAAKIPIGAEIGGQKLAVTDIGECSRGTRDVYKAAGQAPILAGPTVVESDKAKAGLAAQTIANGRRLAGNKI